MFTWYVQCSPPKENVKTVSFELYPLYGLNRGLLNIIAPNVQRNRTHNSRCFGLLFTATRALLGNMKAETPFLSMLFLGWRVCACGSASRHRRCSLGFCLIKRNESGMRQLSVSDFSEFEHRFKVVLGTDGTAKTFILPCTLQIDHVFSQFFMPFPPFC